MFKQIVLFAVVAVSFASNQSAQQGQTAQQGQSTQQGQTAQKIKSPRPAAKKANRSPCSGPRGQKGVCGAANDRACLHEEHSLMYNSGECVNVCCYSALNPNKAPMW